MKHTNWVQFTPPSKLCAIIAVLLPVLASNAQAVDLGTISKNKTVKYVAVGSSLSAGVKNGGLTSAGQQTSFPALIAQQMGVKNFRQATVDAAGTGTTKVRVNKTGLIVFDVIQGADDAKLPKVSTEVDNLAVPYLKVLGMNLSEKEADSWPENYSKKGFKHLNRLVTDAETSKTSYVSAVEKKVSQADFFTYELGMQDFIEFFEAGGYLSEVSFLTYDREGYFPEDNLLKNLMAKGAKGVMANVPEVRELPYFAKYKFANLKNKIGNEVYIQRYTKNDVRLAVDGDVFLPGRTGVDELINGMNGTGLSPDSPILDEDVIGVEERWSVKTYNAWLTKIAENNKLPIVDLYGLYERILKGELTTDDGVKVNPSYPEGNFFSADGISPTAFGQAIIANEYIKVINASYGAKIPLITTQNYLNQ